jgi:hypothetical protein
MTRCCKNIFIFLLASLPVLAVGQDLDAHSPKQNDPVSKQQRAAEGKKAKQKAKQEKAEKDFKKRNMDLQTKAVRKRMKKNKKKADKWNENK